LAELDEDEAVLDATPGSLVAEPFWAPFGAGLPECRFTGREVLFVRTSRRNWLAGAAPSQLSQHRRMPAGQRSRGGVAHAGDAPS
jgi:hypothetical protein